MFFFWFEVKPLKGWVCFQTFFNLLYVSINTTGRSSHFLLNSFTCWTWLKQLLHLGSKYILKFGVSLGAILTHLEIWRGILDNWNGNPLALSFQNTPRISELERSWLRKFHVKKTCFVYFAVCSIVCRTLPSLQKKIIYFKDIFCFLNHWSRECFRKKTLFQ